MRTANLIIATVSMIAVIGCGSTSIRCSKTIGDKSMQDKSEQVNSGEHGIKYFPDGVFSKRDDLNKWTTAWYSCELKAMNEPSLYDLTGQRNERIYRFLWLRSFHDPVVVRVRILDDGSAILIVKKADRMEE